LNDYDTLFKIIDDGVNGNKKKPKEKRDQPPKADPVMVRTSLHEETGRKGIGEK
jgi:hypothetical protein